MTPATADAVVSLTVVTQLPVIHVLPKTVIEKFAVSTFTLIEKSFVSTLK